MPASTLDDLWNGAPPGEGVFTPEQVVGLPEGARRYLEHAIAPGTRLANAVRLRMHGEIRLKAWLPFTAEQVIAPRGFIWQARVRMRGLPVAGFDRLVDGAGEMRWRLLGLIPVMSASGPDITRSAIGRAQAESIWLPSSLLGQDVTWTEDDPLHPRARLTTGGETAELELPTDEAGRLQSVRMMRWGDPDGKGFRYESFGAIVEAEGAFGGYAIPTRVRVGWFFGAPRFETDGEFFRATVDEAAFR